MLGRLPKEVREKYAPPVPPETPVVLFAMKTALVFVLFFLGAIGLDIRALLN